MTSFKARNIVDYFVVCGLDTNSGLESTTDQNGANDLHMVSNGDEASFSARLTSRPPLERSYKNKVLKHYPENLPWNVFDEYAVTQLCMPNGLVFQKHSSKPRFHPFLITREDGSRVHGAALTFFELCEDEHICNAMQTLQTMYDAEYSHYKSSLQTTINNTTKMTHHHHHRSLSAQHSSSSSSTSDNTSPSSNNNNKQIVSYHQYNILKARLYASKCICLLSLHPFNKCFSSILNTLFTMVADFDLLGMSLESHLYNLLYETQMPNEGQLIQFSIGCKQNRVYMPNLSSQSFNHQDLPIYDYDLFEFFRLLGVTNFVNLYTTALLEHQILLYSTNLELLMLVAESLTTLMFPFTWLEPYVPIVPASNLHFIEAPVPYIMGFHSNRDMDKEFLRQGQKCFVDIDSGHVQVPEGVPDFPDKNKFIKEINELIQYFGQKKSKFIKNISDSSNAYSRLNELALKCGAINENKNSSAVNEMVEDEEVINAQFVRAIRELFLQRFVQMFASYEKFVNIPVAQNSTSNKNEEDDYQIESFWLNKDYAGNFDSKMFLIEQPSPRLPFLSHFIETQMFVRFVDLKILSIVELRRHAKMVKTKASMASNGNGANGSEQKEEEFDPNKLIDPNVRIFDEKIKKYKELEYELNQNNSHQVILSNNSDLIRKLHAIDIKEIESDILKKLTQNALQIGKARPLPNNSNSSSSNQLANLNSNLLFENINDALLKVSDESIQNIYNEIKRCKDEIIRHRNHFKNQLKLSIDKPAKIRKTRKHSNTSRVKQNTGSIMSDSTTSVSITTNNNKISPKSSSELNPIFIQSLLKESKMKTKRMLVEKMPETANLGHVEGERISGIEENMLIAGLCDLIERIWSHGHHNKSGSSALWYHLINYRKLIQYLRPNSINGIRQFNADIKTASPRFSTMPRKPRTTLSVAQSSNSNIPRTPENQQISMNKQQLLQSAPFYHNRTQTTSIAVHLTKTTTSNNNHKRAQSVSNNENHNHFLTSNNHLNVNNNGSNSSSTFSPLNNDLLADLERIDKLSEVKTEIGMARAFVRLSLEKKILADHLRQLLSEADLLRALYKRHAFLRQEEEREQFIYHLQSLNVVDYFCFTNHFKSIQTNYSILIVPSRKFNSSTTSANPYIKLFGSLEESDVYAIPKNTFEFVISCNHNLGQLTTMVIGHDNAGMTPKWMIECIFVRNEITGHIYKFPCGRWLGKGVDDDSLERLLIGESLNLNDSLELVSTQHNSSFMGISSPYNMSRSRSPTLMMRSSTNNEEKKTPTSSNIQETLGNAINTLVKYFEKPEIERNNLTSLMCGENGLVQSMDQVFTFGFKYQKFFKRLYVWDFLEKACVEFEQSTLNNNNSLNTSNSQNNSSSFNGSQSNNNSSLTNRNFVVEKFRNVIRSINVTSANYGKDGKLQIFICLACRDSFLSDWFLLLSKSHTANQMYDEYSFMRNYELNKFGYRILSIVNQFNFKLENSLTMGDRKSVV